jgi:hypothetical protein
VAPPAEGPLCLPVGRQPFAAPLRNHFRPAGSSFRFLALPCRLRDPAPENGSDLADFRHELFELGGQDKLVPVRQRFIRFVGAAAEQARSGGTHRARNRECLLAAFDRIGPRDDSQVAAADAHAPRDQSPWDLPAVRTRSACRAWIPARIPRRPEAIPTRRHPPVRRCP